MLLTDFCRLLKIVSLPFKKNVFGAGNEEENSDLEKIYGTVFFTM